ncbi:zf-HC2 domain-containing protein [Paenarthrobacter sp. PH39-S1]|uniref:anti-sigma factor family protein n=1 Tax=Paenarthrobacter sp. PH39-S1 TaxID=3046204 RepID=UPI0024BB3A43|nr:zf-HC2 domain-containing protein [Paenarthrobacter sp. PH39-S1]MDJ0355226.1 zf-HC2 domain-containing protein [Paenarthrobacter sp. PH39-S1]
MIPVEPDKYREWDAAYVLGSLVPAERAAYERHLAGCTQCRTAVAELAGLPGLLAEVAPADALASVPREGAEVPQNLLTGLAGKIRRRRFRTRVGMAALAVGISTASVGVTLAVTPPPSAVVVQTQAAAVTLDFASVVAGPINAVGTLTSQPWGTRLDWTCTYSLASGPTSRHYASPSGLSKASGLPEPSGLPDAVAPVYGYTLVVIDRRGAEVQVASWTAGPGTRVTPTATTSIVAADIARVEIRSAGGEILLAAEP